MKKGNQKYDFISDYFAQKINEAEPEKQNFIFDEQEFLQPADYQLNLKDFEGKDLKDVFPEAKLVENREGKFWILKQNVDLKLDLLSSQKAKNILKKDLKLIDGIWAKTETQLKNTGYRTIDDLKRVSRFSEKSKNILQFIENQDVDNLHLHIFKRYKIWSAISYLALTGFMRKTDFLFFDIESLGIYNSAIFLIGIGYFQSDIFTIEQFLATDYEQEPAILFEFLKISGSKKAFVSFNGRAFDFNYINKRLNFYFLGNLPNLPHFDLLHIIRKFWHNLQKWNLKFLEAKLLNFKRLDDIDSALVPDFYKNFISSKNLGYLYPIITHNFRDILSIAQLFNLLQKKLINYD